MLLYIEIIPFLLTIKSNNYLKLNFKGDGANTHGIGTKVIIPLKKGKIVQELYTTRGYQSAVNSDMIIGLGKMEKIDSLIIIWPDKRFQILTDVKANQKIQADQHDASGSYDFSTVKDLIFEDVTNKFSLGYVHHENKFIEYNREALIPHMASTEGPRLAICDINGDGLEDFFIGGAKWQPGAIYLQTKTGFTKSIQPELSADSLCEDVGAVFVDVDHDKDLDLVVVSGGNEFRLQSDATLVRLYTNNGHGVLSRDRKSLPDVHVMGSCVKVADFNQDGAPDLFVGGRVVPWHYGEIPRSYLLENDGKGNFSDVTFETGGKELSYPGMVKDAAWSDVDGDGNTDLVLVGEWMPITIFFNDGKVLEQSPKTVKDLALSSGWWNAVLVDDADGDGHEDIIAGNLGLNSKLKASPEEPVEMYVKDFDKNGQIDQLLFYYIEGKQVPFATRDELINQMPDMEKKFPTYEDFARAGKSDIVSSDELDQAMVYQAFEFRSGIFQNLGDKSFVFKPFPIYTQISPINAFVKQDYNHDGKMDLVAAGNFYDVNVQRGRCDASYGMLLQNNGDGSYIDIPNRISGLKIQGQIRDLKVIRFGNNPMIVIAGNNEPIQIIRARNPNPL